MSIAWQDEAHTEHEIQLIWFLWKHSNDANSVTEPFKQAAWLFLGSMQYTSIWSNGQHSPLSSQGLLQLCSNILTSEVDGIFHPLSYKHKVCCVNIREIFFPSECCRWVINSAAKLVSFFPLRQEKDCLPWLSFRSARNSVSVFIH